MVLPASGAPAGTPTARDLSGCIRLARYRYRTASVWAAPPADWVAATLLPVARYSLHVPAPASHLGTPCRTVRHCAEPNSRLRIVSATTHGGLHWDCPRSAFG